MKHTCAIAQSLLAGGGIYCGFSGFGSAIHSLIEFNRAAHEPAPGTSLSNGICPLSKPLALGARDINTRILLNYIRAYTQAQLRFP
jgi:hypothetical protein